MIYFSLSSNVLKKKPYTQNLILPLIKVDILDTAGDMQFPAMRRLCIATAHAFLLVYAVTSAPSFDCIKQCFEEVREQRADYQEIPIVVAGNKLDLTSTHREVRIEDVSEWVYCELPKLRWDGKLSKKAVCDVKCLTLKTDKTVTRVTDYSIAKGFKCTSFYNYFHYFIMRSHWR